MCALFGWLDYKGIVPYRVLKKLEERNELIKEGSTRNVTYRKP